MKLKVFAIFFCGTACAMDYVIRHIEECSSSGKTSTINKCHTDKAKKTLILEANVTETVTKMNVSLTVYMLTGGKFQQLFMFPDMDWCKFMKKDLKTSAVFKIIFDAIKSSSSGASSLLHKCPYFGLHVANISVSTNVIRIVPPSLYRLTYLVNTDVDENFWSFTGDFQIGEPAN